jgi:DNA uptake protein ComE-like DNA-binding protein
LYWNTDSSMPRKGFMPWEELARRQLHAVNAFEIELGRPTRISVVGCGFPRDDLSFLLSEIQTHLLRNQPGNAGLPRAQGAPPLPPVAHQEWTLAVGGEQFGPYDGETIRSLVAAHRIDPAECIAWRPGLADWVPLNQIMELSAGLPARLRPTERRPLASQLTAAGIQASDHAAAEQVDINTASIDALLELPWINLVLAKELAQERDRRGGFTSLEEVGEFLQLQPHEVEALRRRVTFGTYSGQVALLDLNQATETELAQLPGIGPIFAKRAVRIRTERGGFRSVDELTGALNLSPRIAARIKEVVQVAPLPVEQASGPPRRIVDY